MRSVGSEKERIAGEYLKRHGYVILATNYRNRFGEIDIIAAKDSYLCFVEVKYRSGVSAGMPEEAVHSKKQRKISQVAQYYLCKEVHCMDVDCRFDVVCILRQQGKEDEISLIPNAFYAIQ